MTPNIVLVVADTLRADRMGCYGYWRDTTPALDSLARSGVTFRRAFAQNNATEPSFTTIFTGVDPLRHGVVGHVNPRHPSDEFAPMAALLREAGYRTAAVDSLGRWFPAGFDDYRQFTYEMRAPAPHRTGEQVTDEAIAALEELSGLEPFFLFAHYWDPHTPYVPPPPYDQRFQDPKPMEGPSALERASAFPPLSEYFRTWLGEHHGVSYVRDQYDGEVAYLDQQVGRLLDRVLRVRPPGSTLFIFTSDHGESLGEHSIYFDHHGLYDPQLHVPLILSWPGQLPERLRVNALVGHTDVLPTLLDLLSLPAPNCLDGSSLLPLIRGSALAVTPAVLACEGSWQVKLALRTDRWKLIYSLRPDYHQSPECELYDLESDPEETENLAGDRPAIKQQLTDPLLDWSQMRVAQNGGVDPLADAPTLRPTYLSGRDIDPPALIEKLSEQGVVRATSLDGLTSAEREIVEQRLRALGYL